MSGSNWRSLRSKLKNYQVADIEIWNAHMWQNLRELDELGALTDERGTRGHNCS